MEYILEMFNRNQKELQKAKMIAPFHQKATYTLQAVIKSFFSKDNWS